MKIVKRRLTVNHLKKVGGDFMKRIITILFCIALCLVFGGITTLAVAQDCRVGLINDTMIKSRWLPRPALMKIDTAFFEDPISQETVVKYTSDCSEDPFPSIIPLGKLVNRRTGRINQLVIIMPAISTGNFYDLEETVTVKVEGCENTCCCNLSILGVKGMPTIE
jgi:hypothetical protein